MNTRLPLLIRMYRASAVILEPAVIGLLYWRQRKGLEDRARMGERQGYANRGRPPGPLVWVHGASIGETISLLPVIERLTQRGVNVLATSGTRTSAALIARRLPPGAFHQFVPLDVPRYIRNFLDYWQPDLALVAESEIWPNIITELYQREIPLIHANARMSERSFQRWRRMPGVIGALLERFALCLAQSEDDAERFAELGAPRVLVTGNLKFDAPAPPADPKLVAHLSGLIAGRPVWLAASTHEGEEEIIIGAHRALAARHPHLLTIIVPRHPHRGAEIAAMAHQAGMRAGLRSMGTLPDRTTDIYVADTIGETGLFFRLSSLVFMGGSLVPHGGQNPIEPVKLGAAILHGPHVHNFTEAYSVLNKARGALAVGGSSGLALAVDKLLSEPALVRDMARAGGDALQALTGAVERTLQSIEPYVLRMKLEARR